MTKLELAVAFSNGKFKKCFNYLTEQTIWNIPGEQNLSGKVAIVAFCEKTASYFKSVTTNFKQLHVIENENCVAITGTAEFISEGKRIAFVSSCDVYAFTSNNEIMSITSYCITENFK